MQWPRELSKRRSHFESIPFTLVRDLAGCLSALLVLAAVATVAVLTRSRWEALLVGLCFLLTAGIAGTLLQPGEDPIHSYGEPRNVLVSLCVITGLVAAGGTIGAIRQWRSKRTDDIGS